jgi:hypothetical protein
VTPETLIDWGIILIRLACALFLLTLAGLLTGVLFAAWVDFVRWVRRAPDASASSGFIAIVGTPLFIGGVLWVICKLWA